MFPSAPQQVNLSITPALSLAPLFIGKCCHCSLPTPSLVFSSGMKEGNTGENSPYIILDLGWHWTLVLTYTSYQKIIETLGWEPRKLRLRASKKKFMEVGREGEEIKMELCVVLMVVGLWRGHSEEQGNGCALFCGLLQALWVCTAPHQSQQGSDVFTWTGTWPYPVKLMFHQTAELPSR